MSYLDLMESAEGTPFARAKGTSGKTARERFIANIEAQIEKLTNPDSAVKATFREHGDRMAFGLKYGNVWIKLKGELTDVHVPLDKFEDVLEEIIGAVQSGDFDDQLEGIRRSFVDRVQQAPAKKS